MRKKEIEGCNKRGERKETYRGVVRNDGEIMKTFSVVKKRINKTNIQAFYKGEKIDKPNDFRRVVRVILWLRNKRQDWNWKIDQVS